MKPRPPLIADDGMTRGLIEGGWIPVIGTPGPFGPDLRGEPMEVYGLTLYVGGSFTGWTCPCCTAVVRIPNVHQAWHERYGTWDLSWIETSEAAS